MAAKTETAEQKLLKMIEATSAPADAKSKTLFSGHSKSLLTIIASLNKVLTIGVVVAVVFLCYEIIGGIRTVNSKIEISSSVASTAKGFDAPRKAPLQQGLPYYMASVKKRNIFLPYEESAKRQVAESTTESKEISSQTRFLRLVGISWLNTIDSASVMLEDTDKKVTHFLQKGEKLGDITVKTIYADSVKLGYQNEEIIIRYDQSQM